MPDDAPVADDTPASRPPLKLELFLWALVLPFAWHALALLPLLLFTGAASPHALFLAGVAGATWAVFAIERRMPIGRVLPLSWRPRRPALVAAAFVAGMGMTILASEIGNVVLTIWPRVVSAAEPGPRWWRVAMGGVAAPAVLGLLFPVLVGRALLVLAGRRRAVTVVAVWGGLLAAGWSGSLQDMPQLGLLLGLATWTHVFSGSVWLPLAVFAPGGAVEVLQAFDLAPGIVGFDYLPGGVVFQPVWFDLLGAALLALGVGALARVLDPPPKTAP